VADLNKRIIIALIPLLVVVLAVWGAGQLDRADKAAEFQGYVEGEFTLVGPEEGGRIVGVSVDEGDIVKRDQALFELDNSIQTAQLREANARLDEAKARLDNLKSEQMRASEISVLEARERQARAALELSRKEMERKSVLFLKRVVSQAEVDKARTTLERDTAALAEIQDQIRVAHLAARSEQIRAAEASVQAARATTEQARIRIEKRIVKAPVSGRVQAVYFESGEVVGAGQPVVSLLAPEKVKILFYVPEPKLSGIEKNMTVHLSCDGCPAGMTGRVVFISAEAEFTPPVIFGPKERAKLVFRVEARPGERARRLSPGQPVTVSGSTVSRDQ
jgi:HlyD family secretion protein